MLSGAPLRPVQADDLPSPLPVRLASTPALSPDGKRIAFSWAGDIWTARTQGGLAKRFTAHAAYDSSPAFSPDSKRMAFTSNRTGQDQVFVAPAAGGIARQVTFHSEGSRLVDWYPDGKSLLIEGPRDFGTRSAIRLYRVELDSRKPERLLFDAEATSAALSPDGKRLLFCREGGDLYRKGYRGSKASQIWLAEGLETAQPSFKKIIARESEARSPLWKADGSGFYYLGDHGETQLFDVWEYNLKTGQEKRLTQLKDDPAITPAISRDGSTIVFRKEFEFQRLALAGKQAGQAPRAVALEAAPDVIPSSEVRRVLNKATNVSFSADGLEIAFIAGGDVWVMDSELREPVAVTQTPEEEREPLFSADGETLHFIRDGGVTADIWSASRADSKAYWWRNTAFKETKITKDGTLKRDLQHVPGGKRLSWISGRGDLWTANGDGGDSRRLLESWNAPQYEWSPDGQWLAYAVEDNDFNRDVWIAPVDGKTPAYNLSRHPDSDGDPHWSPDGKMLAFTGRRYETETDIYYVHLSLSEEEKDKRDRSLESALKKMETARKKPEPPKAEPPKAEPAKAEPATTEPTRPEPAKTEPPKPAPATTTRIAIDFDRLYERIHRISIPDATESGLFWSPDSKKLAFAAEIKGVKGTYTVSFPDPGTPAALSPKQGSLARWSAKGDTIYWLVEGVPSSQTGGNLRSYNFAARQSYDAREYRLTGFRQIWRTMRDVWYDEALNHRDWDAVRVKYEKAAADAADTRAFDRVVAMMLGELNGSHLGYKSSADSAAYTPPQGWSEETAHLGLVFDRFFAGPGWKVAGVIPEGPADQVDTRLKVGDVVMSIDGHPLNRDTDPTTVLNGPPARDIRLSVARDRETKGFTLRPISFTQARALLQNARDLSRHALVEKLSQGRVGYVSVERMDWSEFIRFEEEIFARGHGKDALLIDVRDNGGGFTADHLLTVLTPAEHAITVPRGGGPGYPQDRRVYATWNKPVAVLCNQNSFSNAEIFSHAIKELKRGKLVGVPTAGGVISTGAAGIMDLGLLRIPFRGWYRKSDGADMELNGARPDAIVWPEPGDESAGKDRQIEKAIELLLKDIDAAKAKPAPELKPASGRAAPAKAQN